MYCIYCGAKNPENAKFCYSCGRNISALAQAASQWPKSQKPDASVLRQTQDEIREKAMNVHIKEFFNKDRGAAAPEPAEEAPIPKSPSIWENSSMDTTEVLALPTKPDVAPVSAAEKRINVAELPSVSVQPIASPQSGNSEQAAAQPEACAEKAANKESARQPEPAMQPREPVPGPSLCADSSHDSVSRAERIARDVSESIKADAALPPIQAPTPAPAPDPIENLPEGSDDPVVEAKSQKKNRLLDRFKLSHLSFQKVKNLLMKMRHAPMDVYESADEFADEDEDDDFAGVPTGRVKMKRTGGKSMEEARRNILIIIGVAIPVIAVCIYALSR